MGGKSKCPGSVPGVSRERPGAHGEISPKSNVSSPGEKRRFLKCQPFCLLFLCFCHISDISPALLAPRVPQGKLLKDLGCLGKQRQQKNTHTNCYITRCYSLSSACTMRGLTLLAKPTPLKPDTYHHKPPNLYIPEPYDSSEPAHSKPLSHTPSDA